ncbi:mucin-2 isoform X2 [Achroia grisella]|uniref:mucin-2 isoform X2 n=1 Tax=Achroia grisella TaxID=688607 RepID=UPI0027D270B0|nr:mucin-2 isoform X2 [Achroia grisella]
MNTTDHTYLRLLLDIILKLSLSTVKLPTYFIPEEGFLAGLALNNENVTFNDSYKKILRFYGFDLDNDQLPTFAPGTNNSTNETTTTASPSSSEAPATTAGTTAAATTESAAAGAEASTAPTREETTTNPNAETINDIDIRGPTPTTTSPGSASNAESTTNSLDESTTLSNTVEEIASPTLIAQTGATDTTIQTTTTVATTTSNELMTSSTTVEASSTLIVPDTSSTTLINSESTVFQPSSTGTTVALNDASTMNNEVDAMTTREVTTSTTENSPETTAATSTMTTNSNTETETQQAEQMSTSSDMSTTTESTTINDSTLETLERRKKSIVDFVFTNPPYVDDYLVYKSYDIGPNSELPSTNFDDSTNFLANGLKSVQVTYMHYDTILEHAYLPHLEASALRLPLDSDRYYLLVVLPTRGGVPELGRLLARMARESDLSDVYSALRPRRVRAIVPSFTVKGHVALTTDLQKLGIRDVFEPRQRDFNPMTNQAGVYVRSIEQAVSVAIRKYQPDDQKKNRYVSNHQPVRFSATYPFLYFVMDASIHVALMAGKMVDPLNTRIL